MQKRIGKLENGLVNRVLRKIATYRVLVQDKHKRETFFNHLLFHHLAQRDFGVTNQHIHSTSLIGQTFRPEFFIKGTSRVPLFCVECKKLTDGTAKQRLKEGLSQALAYSNEYKCVALVFYDFSKGASCNACFSKAGTPESRLAANLWKHHRIKLLFVVPR